MHAVILERNKLVGRKVARMFMSVGATAVTVEEPSQIAQHLAIADVLCADTFDGDYVADVMVAVDPEGKVERVVTRGNPAQGTLERPGLLA